MKDLYSIPGITDEEVNKLNRSGYATAEALWTELAKDNKGTLENLAGATGFSSARLTELLAADVARNGKIVRGGIVARHWLDLVLAGGIALLLWALFVWHGLLPSVASNPVWVRLALKQLPADPNRKTPYRATLVVSAHTAAEPVVEPVTVIQVFPEQVPAATVALEASDVSRIGRLLGTADVYLLQPPK
jgi:hypothetical protein